MHFFSWSSFAGPPDLEWYGRARQLGVMAERKAICSKRMLALQVKLANWVRAPYLRAPYATFRRNFRCAKAGSDSVDSGSLMLFDWSLANAGIQGMCSAWCLCSDDSDPRGLFEQVESWLSGHAPRIASGAFRR